VELAEILQKKERLGLLTSEFEEHESEANRLQEKIYELEEELEYLTDQFKPKRIEMIGLEWELGIRVHKDQLPLFDLQPYKGKIKFA
jgi:chromosome segregation ATPase